MGIEKVIFQRTELLIGKIRMERLSEKRVIIFGIGGVGKLVRRKLVRSGIKHSTIVDLDRVRININRQLMKPPKQ